jgi:hypothetical protein
MVRLFTDFSDSPSLTARWNTTSASWGIQTSSLPSGAGTHALRMVKSVADRFALSFDAAGTPPGDVEILVRWLVNLPNPITANTFAAVIYGSGGDETENGFVGSPGGTTTMLRHRISGGSSSTQSPNHSISLASDTWYWTRLNLTGTTLSIKTWADGSGEPGSWSASSSVSSLTAGWVGVSHYFGSTGTTWVAELGVGTGGDPAPDAPLVEVGAASGSVAFTGAAAGLRTPAVGAASGAVSFSGSASGEIVETPAEVGASSGFVAFSGSASGLRTPAVGAASGGVAFTGAASGLRTPAVGASSGAVAFAGDVAGLRTPAIGAAAGSVAFTGSVSGSVFTPPPPDYRFSVTPRGVVPLTAAGRGVISMAAQPRNTITMPVSAAGTRTLAAAPRGTVTLEVPT